MRRRFAPRPFRQGETGIGASSAVESLSICYIIGTYPNVTTTFIDREIRVLRQWGLTVRLLAVRQPPAHSALSAEQRVYQRQVIYLLPISWPSFLWGNLRYLASRPLIYLDTMCYLVSRRHPDLRSRLWTLFHFAEGVYAAHLLRKEQIQHLHAHFLDRAATIALVAGRLLGVPYSLTAHANSIYVKPTLLPEKMSHAKSVATISEYNREHLTQTLAEAQLEGSIHVVHVGLDGDAYTRALPAGQGQPLVFSVGRLTEKKGFPVLVAACGLLKEQGYRFTCEIVGQGPQRSELEATIRELGLGDTVLLRGAMPHDAVKELYQRAGVFVLPCVIARDGDRDGIPTVLMEAMAMQVPVVSTKLSGIPELIQDGENGLLVAPGDAAALASALGRLFDDPALRAELGSRGRTKVLADFDLERNTRRLYELFVSDLE